MPNIDSAAKRIRSDARKRARNQAVLSEIKTLSKKLVQLTASADKAAAVAQELISRYDRAVTKGVIPRGRADRRKSRVTKFVTKLSAKK
ncbi:MAG: 30S ribosomal protein S20 [Candidatus Omnitrophica bacterium ADurb.Bin292]|jgi:small subunit ribosomal protein S20|nr:MAG: 30S ribosomal protein S20 [Candidatus Omnitrophica bacterium ADurb.Bin292]HOG23089.1 30S ribosomal protein S20 [Candidatus Omnitrophota bacterium]HPW76558.1 30S ribosomal protein S20 [Candidatus Omnitrophota bacterium]HQB11499.1 30S ribosomal protein S20 [Candidatus Omnitrophota bacterium]